MPMTSLGRLNWMPHFGGFAVLANRPDNHQSETNVKTLPSFLGKTPFGVLPLCDGRRCRRCRRR